MPRSRSDAYASIGVLIALALSACTEPQVPSPASTGPSGVSNAPFGPSAIAGSGVAGSQGAFAGAGGNAAVRPQNPGPAVGLGGSSAIGAGGSSAIGAGGSSAGGSAGSAATAGAGGADRADLGKGDGSDVVTIGDSYMQLSAGTAVEPSLERAAGNNYRNYAEQGTRMIGGSNPIPGQYARAVGENMMIATVVMTGGGNDILQERTVYSACAQMPPAQACLDSLPPVLDALSALFEKMSKDGVKDVFFLTYPPAPTGTLAGGVAGILPMLIPMYQSRCDAVPAPLRCHVLDGDDAFKMTPLQLRADGIHPTDAGYALLGEFVYEAMVAAGARR